MVIRFLGKILIINLQYVDAIFVYEMAHTPVSILFGLLASSILCGLSVYKYCWRAKTQQ